MWLFNYAILLWLLLLQPKTHQLFHLRFFIEVNELHNN